MDKILKGYKDQLAANAAEMEALVNVADAEGRELTADEEQRFNALDVECKDLKAKITAREKVLDARSRISGYAAEADRAQPTVAGRSGSVVREPNITRQHNNADDDPKRGFKTHREFHLAVMDAGMGRKVDERLLPLRAAVGSDEQSGFSDSYGGYLLPEGFMGGLMQLSPESDPTAGRTTRVPMSTEIVNINARTDKNHTSSVSGGLQVYRREEAGSVSSSRMQVEQVKLEASMLMGLAYATEEILERSPISFAALLANGFRDEIGAKILSEKLRGTGVGQMEGILNTPALVTVSAETGQSADTILYANVVKMRSRCWRYSQAVWLYNHDTLPELMNMTDGFGRFVWQPSAREGEPDLLLGRPAFATEYASTLGAVGDLILGVWSEYLEGQLEGLRSAESMHVRFVNHERAFKYYLSNAGKVWWRSALTPNQSSSTLSPFVVLAAR